MYTVLWLRRLLTCLILFLLIFNLAYLTINYVRYETDTNVAPYWPVKLNATKLSLFQHQFAAGSLTTRLLILYRTERQVHQLDIR